MSERPNTAQASVPGLPPPASERLSVVPPAPEIVLRPRSGFAIDDVKEFWRYRELIWILGMRDVAVRYKQAVLGIAWALLQPLLQMAVFTVLFNRMAGIRPDAAVPYPLFCFAGLAVWMMFANGLSMASASLVNSRNLITKVYFPRAIIPIAAVFSSLIDFAVTFVLLLGLMLFFGMPLHLGVLMALPIGLCAALCAFALGLWSSAVNLRYRDVQYALPFFIQTLIFVTPVFFPASLLPAKFRLLLALNPMTSVVESFRAALFGTPVPWTALLIACAAMCLVAVLGFIRFRSLERTFSDQV